MLLSILLLKRNDYTLDVKNCGQDLKKNCGGKGMKSKGGSQGLCRNAKNDVDAIKIFDHDDPLQCDQQPHVKPFFNFFIIKYSSVYKYVVCMHFILLLLHVTQQYLNHTVTKLQLHEYHCTCFHTTQMDRLQYFSKSNSQLMCINGN